MTSEDLAKEMGHAVNTIEEAVPLTKAELSDKRILAGRIKKMLDQLSPEDLGRAAAYARDLANGLSLLRTIPQGVTVFGSARVREGNKYYDKARELGGLLAQNGHAVTTGGGPGIMEAANRGAFEYGGRSVGLNITLEHEQFANP